MRLSAESFINRRRTRIRVRKGFISVCYYFLLGVAFAVSSMATGPPIRPAASNSNKKPSVPLLPTLPLPSSPPEQEFISPPVSPSSRPVASPIPLLFSPRSHGNLPTTPDAQTSHDKLNQSSSPRLPPTADDELPGFPKLPVLPPVPTVVPSLAEVAASSPLEPTDFVGRAMGNHAVVCQMMLFGLANAPDQAGILPKKVSLSISATSASGFLLNWNKLLKTAGLDFRQPVVPAVCLHLREFML